MAITINGTDGNPLTYRDVDGTPNGVIYVNGRLAFSGNYPTGGDALDFTTLGDWVPGSTVRQVAIWSSNGNLVRQYVPVGNTSTPLNGWKVKISASSSFGTEFSAGAYAADITADVVSFSAVFSKLV